MLHIITTLTPVYQYSAELSLAFHKFCRSLPEISKIHLIQCQEEDNKETFLTQKLVELLPTILRDDYILLLKEPALLLGHQSIPVLTKLLEENHSIDYVLPSDNYGCRPQKNIDYHTLYGFECFTNALQDESVPHMAYDGRKPFFILCRANALKNIGQINNVFSLPAQFLEKTIISLNTYIHIFGSYYEETREEMISLIPNSVCSLLDVGCSAGKFGSVLKKQRNCKVVGIEINQTQAEKARQHLDAVFCGDALNVDINEQVDCVTCLDSLEHFPEPELLLKRVYNDFLKPEGYLLTSIPNVGHWSIVEDLLAGRWDYVPAGLLCNTHLRFFTRHSIHEMFLDQGFKIINEIPVQVPISNNDKLEKFQLLSQTFTVDMNSLNTLVYHILAKKLT